MLWHVPADFQFFKRSTLGFPVIMGRSSWEALGSSAPLPGRTNIVVTRQPDFIADGALVAHSLDDAITIAHSDGDDVWIAGGAQIYAQAISLADELVVTDLDLTVSEDEHVVYAPTIDDAEWAVDSTRSDATWRERSGDARWRVTTYVRRHGG